MNFSVQHLRKEYREIFMQSYEEIQKKIEDLRPSGVDGDIFDKFEPLSDGSRWQSEVLDMLENDVSKEVYRKFQEVLAYRSQFQCSGCATCCKLACSEFSPEELKMKAECGDNFATQFLSVFVPYESKEEAREVYPEYIQMLEENKEDNVYFYHCPKVTEDNRCPDYEHRPQICRDFPDNPLSILPCSCGYKKWKEEIEPVTLMLHSMIEIVQYIIRNIYANTCRSKFSRNRKNYR